MRIIQIFLLFTLFLFGATCSNNESNSSTTSHEQNTTLVGADSDEHGCKASAGYTWSALKNECIRLFESGIRLDPQEAIADKTVSVFLVFKSEDDDAKGEVYMPGEGSPRLFVKQANNENQDAGTWKSGSFTLRYWKGMYILEDAKEEVLYQGMWDNK